MLKHLRDHRLQDQRGFTLVEVMIALMILTLIIGPLALSLKTSLGVTDQVGAQLTASASRDQLAAQFSRDVASVDASGVSIDPALGCLTPTQDSADTLLVSFNVTDTSGATVVTNRASYWITGSGENTDLVRRACDDVKYGLPKSDGMEAQLVISLGTRGSTADHLTVVHGPGTRRNPCDEISCTIEVNGRHSYQVTAQRRVFGAGTPVQAGKLYSSSSKVYKTLQAGDGSTLPAQLQEFAWPGYFSTAPGLDGPSAQDVFFQIKKVWRGHTYYYTNDGGTIWEEIADTATQSRVKPDYDVTTATWKLDFPDFPWGGDYKIWTYIAPKYEAAKKYGGANGYPVWVDWKPDESVFVSYSQGNDTFDGKTPETPVSNISVGLARARTNNRSTVLVADPDSYLQYQEEFTVGSLHHFRSIVGGHDRNSWKRYAPNAVDPSTSRALGRTKLVGKANSGIGFTADRVTDLILRQLSIDSGPVPTTAGTGAGQSTYGLIVTDSSGGIGGRVILEETAVIARDAQPGAAGTDGVSAKNACWGNHARNDHTSIITGYYSAPVNSADCAAVNAVRMSGYGGAAGAPRCCTGRPGGDGGNGASGAALGGRGGNGCVDGFFDTCGDGGSGQTSGTGSASDRPTSGARGGAPAASAGFVGTGWVGERGTTGGTGADGPGGGGGGGGGATAAARGASGGVGGQGGAAGTPGTGGFPGGGSFGVLVFAKSKATLDAGSSVQANKGGVGGRGGNGGNGGNGGVGGNGAAESGDGAGEGAPGAGGSGGGAGGGGGGGQGGPSYGLYTSLETPQVASISTTPSPIINVQPAAAAGLPGANGTPGLGGSAGQPGRDSSAIFGWTYWTVTGPSSKHGLEALPGATSATGARVGETCKRRTSVCGG